MTPPNRSAIPLAIDVVDQAYVSLFSLSGGYRLYGLDGALRNIRAYLPVATAGTRLVFFRADSVASGCTTRIYPRTTASLNGSTTVYIDLYSPGDAIEVVPTADLSGWVTLNRCVEVLN